jgi:hypothetical protein
MKPFKTLFRRYATVATIACLMAGSGCKKDAVGSERSYMRFKADGVLKDFADCNVVFMGELASVTPTVYYCHITCGVPESYSALSVYTINPITSNNTYTQAINTVTRLPIATLGTYKDNTGDLYISYQAGWPYYDVSITLTEVSAKYVKGKFSGKIRKINGTAVLEITEGEFKAAIP